MKTTFTARQLADPGTAAMEQILRTCVHCGFCNATCPTFQLTGDELDGPRGRIYLIKDMLENETTPVPPVVRHLDRCLSCLSCMSTCPSSVDYMHLVDHARDYIERRHRRSWLDSGQRRALAWCLPHPRRFRVLLRLAQWLLPLRNLLPPVLRAPLDLARGAVISPDRRKREVYFPAESEHKGAVALLAGCAQQVIGANINQATIRLFNRCGFDVHLLVESGCCGAIEHHLGKTALARERIRTNLRTWRETLARVDAVISNAAGCGTMLKDYARLLDTDSELREAGTGLSAMTQDACEFLHKQSLPVKRVSESKPIVVYQPPCSLLHGQKISSQPLELLRGFGFDVRVPAEAYLCCGSAGTYNILQAEMAGKLGQRKAAELVSTGAGVIASANLGCMEQLRQYSDLPIVHTLELLDWASGGPKPAALVNAARIK